MRYQISRNFGQHTIIDTQTNDVIVENKTIDEIIASNILCKYAFLGTELDDAFSELADDFDYFDLLALRRYAVALGFCLEQQELNGSPVFKHDGKCLDLDFHYITLIMSVKFERSSIKRLDTIDGTIECFNAYAAMVSRYPTNSRFLSDVGRKIMTEMLIDAIDDLAAGKLNNVTVH